MTLLQDLRYALRGLVKSSGFAHTPENMLSFLLNGASPVDLTIALRQE